MTNITTLQHHAAHANTAEQRKAAEDLAREQFDDTMGMFPVQLEHDLQGAIDYAVKVLQVGLVFVCGWACGILTALMVLT